VSETNVELGKVGSVEGGPFKGLLLPDREKRGFGVSFLELNPKRRAEEKKTV